MWLLIQHYIETKCPLKKVPEKLQKGYLTEDRANKHNFKKEESLIKYTTR